MFGTKFLDGIIRLRFGKKKVDFCDVKKPIKMWDVDVNNTVISKSVKKKSNSRYLIEYLDEFVQPLVLVMPKMSGYYKTFKDEGEHKNKNDKLMSLRIDDDKLLNKHKTIWTKIEDLQNIDALPTYDDRYVKTKIWTNGDKFYTNFCGLSVPEDGVECKCFAVICIDSLLVYGNKYYLQVYSNNFAYKTVSKQMVDFLDDNLFETDEDYFVLILISWSYKRCILIKLIWAK